MQPQLKLTVYEIPFSLTGIGVPRGQAGDGTTAAASYDTSIEVQEFPKTGTAYTICTPFRSGRFMLSGGAGQGVAGNNPATPTEAMKWQFVLRDGEQETFDIKNVADNSYIDPTATYNTQLSTTATKPSKGWVLKPAATEGMYVICAAGGVQINQTNSTATGGYAVYNWGSGSNLSDAGCQFLIAEAADISSAPLDELASYSISVSSTPASDLETGKWYVMFDRGPGHGYLYEKSSSHSLYNTSTPAADGLVTAGNAKYLVCLSESGLDGKYYIQTGLGNYFWQFQHGTNVATTPYTSQPITIAKIAGTDGHFYLQSYNGNVVLDANALTNGDATVVGYGTIVPTATGNNNDWAFYPVSLAYSVTLNTVGNSSYATLYLPYDVTLPENTKAYYITEVTDGSAKLTEMTEGIPANTASVLINSEAAASTLLPLTDGLASVVSEDDNLLKGTLTSRMLDLSDATPYYSLGRRDGTIGFYKFNNNGTTTITLGANKAYLEYTGSSGVKGFRLISEDDATGLSGMSGLSGQPDIIYNLAGQRIGKAQKGVNIINGKKVLY